MSTERHHVFPGGGKGTLRSTWAGRTPYPKVPRSFLEIAVIVVVRSPDISESRDNSDRKLREIRLKPQFQSRITREKYVLKRPSRGEAAGSGARPLDGGDGHGDAWAAGTLPSFSQPRRPWEPGKKRTRRETSVSQDPHTSDRNVTRAKGLGPCQTRNSGGGHEGRRAV